MEEKKRTTKQVIAEQQAINRKLWAKENGRLHHLDANKIIAEFMGYKLISCNRGKAWDIGKSIPSKDHLFPIQGVLHTGNELKFHTSWDWLIPVIDKCYQEHMSKHIAEAVMTCNIDVAYKVVVEFIKEHKSKDFDWCNDSGFSDVFDNNLCECTAPQIDEDVCICGRPISNTELKQ